jgi:hypothetical protein
VRHVRAPLAAGYIWLLGVSLLVAPHMPSRTTAEGGLGTMRSLAHGLGPLEVGLIASFVAYLIGEISVSVFAFPIQYLAFVLARARTGTSMRKWRIQDMRAAEAGFTFQSMKSLQTAARERLVEAARVLGPGEDALGPLINLLSRWEEPADRDIFYQEHPARYMQMDYLVEQATAQTSREFDLLGTRLLASQPEVFAEFDRRRSEAEFRRAIVAPLLFVMIVLAVVWTPLTLIGLPIIGLLLHQGEQRAEAASDLLADALLLRQIEGPTLENVRRTAEAYPAVNVMRA